MQPIGCWRIKMMSDKEKIVAYNETKLNAKKERIERNKKILIRFSLIGIIFILLFGTFYTVGAGQRAVVVTLGKAGQESMEPGLHFKIPFVQKAVKFDVKTQKYEADASAASSDLQTVTVKLAINYHVLPGAVPTIYKEIGPEYAARIIQPLEQEVVKATTAQFTAEELITKREQVRDEMKSVLKERLDARGIIVEEVSIVNFDFSESFNAAIENKVTAQQNALAAKNRLEQIQYEAQQRVAQATGEAEAIRIQTAAIQAAGGKEYVQLRAIERWNGAMPMVVGTGTMPFINIPMGGNNS